ncbi:hypothetical protein VNI00_014644 [Paramarasmius palmivorus]|uniref:Uncharacterized protein n=1 Tax=Paramarasmius palmivorus TaxID=297713 RepID=A0AAW0BQG8_9AGAR
MFKNWKTNYQRLAPDPDSEYAEPAPKQTRSLSRRLLHFVVIVETLALLWIWASHRAGHKYPPPALVYSPAQDAIEYHVTKFAIGGDKNFHIPPSDELDAHWENLYNFGISRIPKSQAALLPNKTLPIPGDEEHYIVELRCIPQPTLSEHDSQTLHSDYYTHMAMNVGENAAHMDHCVDWLRQSLMCAGDTSVIVWQWEEEEQKNKFQGDIAHTCRNFEKLHQWGLEHALVNEYDATIRMKDDGIESRLLLIGL